jgi:hypothetical protein
LLGCAAAGRGHDQRDRRDGSQKRRRFPFPVFRFPAPG